MPFKIGKPRIIRETVKDLHTSHWDLDLLTKSELEELMAAQASCDKGETEEQAQDPAEAQPDKSCNPLKHPD